MTIVFQIPSVPDQGTLVLPVFEGAKLSGFGDEIDSKTGGMLKRAMTVNSFTGAAGQSVEVVAPAGIDAARVVLLGLGEEGGLDTLAVEGYGAPRRRGGFGFP